MSSIKIDNVANTVGVGMLKPIVAGRPNCGEDGQIKHVTFGGEMRDRFSSQSFKRPWREQMYEENADLGTILTTNEHLISYLRKEAGASEKFTEAFIKALTGKEEKGKSKANKKKKKSEGAESVLEISESSEVSDEADGADASDKAENDEKPKGDALRRFTKLGLDYMIALYKKSWTPEGDKVKPVIPDDEKRAFKKLNEDNPDLLTFGRMDASNTDFNVDGFIGVSHGFTTNKSYCETDYFTALSDLRPDSQKGFSNSKYVDISSGSYYVAMSLRAKSLVNALRKRGIEDDAIIKYLKDLVRGFWLSFPRGKSASMLSNTIPLYVYADKSSKTHMMTMSAGFELPVETVQAAIDKIKYVVDCRKQFDPTYEFVDWNGHNLDFLLNWILGL